MNKGISFNEVLVRQLAVILDETNLTEIEYEVEGARIKVARQTQINQTVTAPFQSAPINFSTPTTSTPVSNTETKTDITQSANAVKSPMVGSIYLKPSPDAAPFIKIGDKVSVGQTICIIEAMKVMNTIKSPRDGTVTQILADNGSPVEYDQVLMIIE